MSLTALDAERAVIAAILASAGEAMMEVDFLKAEHFADETNALVFELIRTIFEAGGTPDSVTVTEALRDQGVAGADVLTKDYGDPEGGAIREYGNIILGKWRSRSIRTIAEQSLRDVMVGDPDSVLDALSSSIDDLRGSDSDGPVKFGFLDTASTVSGAPKIVNSGFKEIDAYLGGLGAGRLITIAARPAIGKTTLAVNIAANVATAGQTVAIFSLEMAANELSEKMIVREARINGSKVRGGWLDQRDVEAISGAVYNMSTWNLYMDDTPALTTYEISTRAKKIKHDDKLDLVIIDYLQLVSPPEAESRVQEVSMITRNLKVLSRELECPVVVLSQLSRAAEARGGKPRLSDLRESGSIEQDSDQVIFLYRDDDDDHRADDRPVYTEVSVSKNRHGATGDFVYEFIPSQSRFNSL
jgi:replicative DNA helicase